MTIQEKVRAVREDRGLELSEAAGKIGMPRQQWHSIEAGVVKNPGYDTLVKIAEALAITVGELCDYGDKNRELESA